MRRTGQVSDRQIHETVARCISAMVFYHNSERSPMAVELMVIEIRAIAGSVEELGLGVAEVDAQILRPVEAELIARYGHEDGPRMLGQFIDAFESVRSAGT
jgi:hypothetical protein